MTRPGMTPLMLLTIAASALSAGCDPGPSATPEAPNMTQVLTNRPVAIVDETRMDLDDIQASLLEAAGAEVVRERALDRAIAD